MTNPFRKHPLMGVSPVQMSHWRSDQWETYRVISAGARRWDDLQTELDRIRREQDELHEFLTPQEACR